MGVTRSLLLGPFYYIQTKFSILFCTRLYHQNLGNFYKCKQVFGVFATHTFTKSTKVDILEAFPYVDVTTTSGFSRQTGNEAELTFLSDLTENSKTSAIKCLFTVDRLLKLSISANCNFCGNIIKNEGN